MANIIALTYHGLGEPADPVAGARFTVTVPEFDAQVNALWNVVAPETATQGGCGVVLTFDDGEESVAREALPRLAARGIRAALFMTTGWIGRRGYLTMSGLKDLLSAGWLIGAHGHSHRCLDTLPQDEIDDELRRSRDRLGELLGHAPRHLSLPGGRYSDHVISRAALQGFDTLWTSRPGIMKAPLRDRLLRRTAIRRGTPTGDFIRIVSGDRATHFREQLRNGVRALASAFVGPDRYHALTGQVLDALGRK